MCGYVLDGKVAASEGHDRIDALRTKRVDVREVEGVEHPLDDICGGSRTEALDQKAQRSTRPTEP